MTASLHAAPPSVTSMTPAQLAQLPPATFREAVNRHLGLHAPAAFWTALADPEVICRTLRVLTQACASAQRTDDRHKATLEAIRLRGADPAEEAAQLDRTVSNMRFMAMAADRRDQITEALEGIRPGAWWPTAEGADAHRAYVAFATLVRAVAAHRDAPDTASEDDLDDALYTALEALTVGPLTAEQFAATLDALPAAA
jgi:hypothetical protein